MLCARHCPQAQGMSRLLGQAAHTGVDEHGAVWEGTQRTPGCWEHQQGTLDGVRPEKLAGREVGKAGWVFQVAPSGPS